MVVMPKTLPLLVDTSPICCEPLGATPTLTADDAVALAVRLKALADPTRLQLVAFLLGAPNWEACTCDLAPVVGLSEATVSHHLRKLLEAGSVHEAAGRHERLVPAGAGVAVRHLPDARPALLLSRCARQPVPGSACQDHVRSDAMPGSGRRASHDSTRRRPRTAPDARRARRRREGGPRPRPVGRARGATNPLVAATRWTCSRARPRHASPSWCRSGTGACWRRRSPSTAGARC